MDSKTYSQAVARNVLAAIRTSGLSFAAVAEASGVPRSTLDRKLRIGVGDLTVREVKSLADALGTTAQALTTVVAVEVAA